MNRQRNDREPLQWPHEITAFLSCISKLTDLFTLMSPLDSKHVGKAMPGVVADARGDGTTCLYRRHGASIRGSIRHYNSYGSVRCDEGYFEGRS